MKKNLLLLTLAASLSLSSLGPVFASPNRGEELVRPKESLEIVRTNFKANYPQGDVEIHLPVFKGLDDSVWEAELNQLLKSDLVDRLANFTREDKGREALEGEKSELKIDYSIKSKGRFISLVVEEYSIFRGDANGENKNYYFNIDLENKKLIRLSDLFKNSSDYTSLINEEIRSVIRSNQDLYFPIEGAGEAGGLGFKSISEDQDFYINKVGDIVIAFGQYEIAPRSAGIPEFIITRDLIDSTLVEENLVNSVISTRKYRGKNEAGINIIYPQLDGLKDNRFETLINSEIDNFIAGHRNDFLSDSRSKDPSSNFNVGYKVFSEDQDAVSFKLDIYSYLEGDANGENFHAYYNLDLKNFKKLSLKDLTSNPSYIEDINSFIASEIQKNKIHYFNGEDGFKSISSQQDFFIDSAGGLNIVFKEYDIAPRYMGAVNFKIPSSIIRPNF